MIWVCRPNGLCLLVALSLVVFSKSLFGSFLVVSFSNFLSKFDSQVPMADFNQEPFMQSKGDHRPAYHVTAANYKMALIYSDIVLSPWFLLYVVTPSQQLQILSL